MLTMAKDHVIKCHKKTSLRPTLAPGSTVNDWSLRLHQALWSPHNNPHYIRLMRRHPILSGYARHRRWALRTTPPREREPAYLSGSFSSVDFSMLGSYD
ncbi:hypothetical protein AVEN_142670-1 [Araneus ventricosus]|uniref:Uncharacterized protein n=1 Tax=Araneus ventricosus TaxID=182803 RepID=A0A4Y2N620_ARAVE|nr:hypothetical protein AVEN_142670-1 [Araneus ventricosus]